MSHETLSFQAEVSKLLDIVAHSLYSHKEIFLRELVSNASDACDKLRYAALTNPDLMAGDPDFKITIALDKDAKTLTLSDNGVGMNRDDLIENLGTIARSGTENFVKNLKASKDDEKNGDVSLIGQFGVGFYSAFMVADKVTVTTRKAGDEAAWSWISDGKGEFTIDDASREMRGTTIVLHLNENGEEFADPFRVRSIIKTYSDHIAIPIVLLADEGQEVKEGEEAPKDETINSASALWTRAKSEITDEQYKEFYHHVSHGYDDPWLTLHNRVEGVIEYTSLLFIPTQRPFDIFDPNRKPKAKLYVKRVFITDDCEELLPSYLRFMHGIVDASDLPLNISREMLQHNPVLAKIRSGLVKKIIAELSKKSEKKPEEYITFWEAFGAVLKEGIYEDFGRKTDIAKISRFKSTNGEGWVSLDDYVGRMKDGQEKIFYITGDQNENLAASPQLEGFKAKGVEVLLLDDPIDEFWLPSLGAFDEKSFESVTRGGAELGKIADDENADDDAKKDEVAGSDLDTLIAAMKLALGEEVKDVRKSERLTDSAVCLVADDGDMDMHLQRMLAQHGQLNAGATAKVMEINASHAVVKKLAAIAGSDADTLGEAAKLLLDQARIVEGEQLTDAAAFAKRLTMMMEKGLV